MKTFTAKNSNDMAAIVYSELLANGVEDTSRNGNVLRLTEPVMLCYTNPWHRANFTHHRDANIFFHLAEAMWMLAGRNDVAFLNKFNGNMKNYSDNGKVFNAAYGYRTRFSFRHDQLEEVVKILKENPTSRQAAIRS